MVSLSTLNDQQNHLLTQLSYQSHRLSKYEGQTLSQIYASLNDSDKKGDFGSSLKEMIDADLGTLAVKDTGNDYATGFGAVAFEDYEGNTGISYRGTDGISWDSLNDWGDNILALATGTSAQSAQAEAFFDRNRDPNGNNYLYGHSKGGELSESVYVNNYDDIKEVHLLNPQPLNPYSLTPDQWAAMQSGKVDIVIVEGDYVWFLGKLPSYFNIRIMKNTGGNAHSYDSRRYSNGNIIEGTMPWWEYLAYGAINTITSGIQIIGSGIGVVYNGIVRVVDFIASDLIPQAMEFIGMLGEAIQKFADGLKQFAHDVQEFLSSVVDKAVEWFRTTFDSGYRYASQNTYIRVNTDTLRNYAGRLSRVNQRIVSLDRRMDRLYTQVGLFDLWDLLQADLLTGYSWRINRCINYLNDTAYEFEQAERSISSQV